MVKMGKHITVVALVFFLSVQVHSYSPRNQAIINYLNQYGFSCGFAAFQITTMKNWVDKIQEKTDQRRLWDVCEAQWQGSLSLLQHTTNCQLGAQNVATTKAFEHLEEVIKTLQCQSPFPGNQNICNNVGTLKTLIANFKSATATNELQQVKSNLVSTLQTVVKECEQQRFRNCC